MSLHIRTAVRDGVERVWNRNGAVLTVAFLLTMLLQSGFVMAITTTYLPVGALSAPAGSQTATTPTPGSHLPVFVSLGAGLIAALAGGFLTTPVTVVAIRTFVGGRADRIPDEFVFDRLGWATINSLVGSWFVSLSFFAVFVACLGVGSVGLTTVVGGAKILSLVSTVSGIVLLAVFIAVLALPSAFLGICLLFVGQEIAARDKNVLAAVVGSWRLTRGNRLRLFVLAILPIIPHTIIIALVYVVLSPLPAQIVVIPESIAVSMVTLSIMTCAYLQLVDGFDSVNAIRNA